MGTTFLLLSRVSLSGRARSKQRSGVEAGSYRPREQTGRRPVVIWQSDTLTRALQSVLVVPLTTNLDRTNLAGTALISSTAVGGPPQDSVALAFQMRAIPKSALQTKIRDLDDTELEELELATDE